MASRGKDLAKLGTIAACLVIVGVLWWRSAAGGGSTGIQSIDPSETVLTRCANPNCQVQANMEKRVYYEALQTLVLQNPNIGHPPLVCSKCSKKSIFRVTLCPKCDHVFKHAGMRNEPADRCPQCRHSQSVEDRKQGV